jgi:hypothetical protein
MVVTPSGPRIVYVTSVGFVSTPSRVKVSVISIGVPCV